MTYLKFLFARSCLLCRVVVLQKHGEKLFELKGEQVSDQGDVSVS